MATTRPQVTPPSLKGGGVYHEEPKVFLSIDKSEGKELFINC